jgi:hypothetical protein
MLISSAFGKSIEDLTLFIVSSLEKITPSIMNFNELPNTIKFYLDNSFEKFNNKLLTSDTFDEISNITWSKINTISSKLDIESLL